MSLPVCKMSVVSIDTNALRIVRKYVLEFFQPLAAPPNNHKTSKPPKRVQTWRSRDARDNGDSKKPTTSSNGYNGAKLWTPRDTARGDAETTKLHLRGDGVALEPSGTTATPVSSIGGD